MNHMIDDNRFVLIEKYKQRLVEGTNIESRPEEMAVLDSILFRFWQMGWLDKLEQSEPHWHPVSEQPQEEDDYLLLTHEEFKHGTFKRIIIGAWNSATKEWLEDYGDMYRAVNHPVAWISKDELLLLKGYEVTE